jgi:hypothetical protein
MSPKLPQLVEGVDYTMEGDRLVFTALYHLKRGYCCNSGCRHCPYRGNGDAAVAETIRVVMPARIKGL